MPFPRAPVRRHFALETIGLTKTFGSLVANDDVSLRVPAGTVHAVVGENGAGKTTLMRMVYGLYLPDAGEIRLGGESVTFNTPATPSREAWPWSTRPRCWWGRCRSPTT